MGRPTKLTAQVQERIVEALRIGNYFEQSVRAAGIHPATAYRWMELGENAPPMDSPEFEALDMEAKIMATANQPFREFREAALSAIAEAEVRDIGFIDKAAEAGTWQAAAWKRERLSPDRWGRTDKVIVSQALVDEMGRQVMGVVTDVLGAVIADPGARARAAEEISDRLARLGGPAAAEGQRA
jgi:transposase